MWHPEDPNIGTQADRNEVTRLRLARSQVHDGRMKEFGRTCNQLLTSPDRSILSILTEKAIFIHMARIGDQTTTLAEGRRGGEYPLKTLHSSMEGCLPDWGELIKDFSVAAQNIKNQHELEDLSLDDTYEWPTAENIDGSMKYNSSRSSSPIVYM